MGETTRQGMPDTGGSRLVRDTVLVLAVGVILGLAYNYLGLRGNPVYGLTWLATPAEDKVFVLEDGESSGEAAGEDYFTEIDDPMAVFTEQADLPEIPDLPRPIQIQMSAAKKFFDAAGALFVDARDEAEFLEGHLPGAINLPFDIAATDPALLESIDTGGRPVIAYCGGGTCETSINIAWFLIESGHTRVTYFPNGFSGWAEAGYPVETGPGEGR